MTLAKISNLICAALNKVDINIDEDTDLVADLGFNSLDLAELICAFEDEFGIEIPDRDVVKLRKVSEIVTYLDNKGIA